MAVKIICVVNNTAQDGLRGEHGLSFWIETGQGTVLYDTGQTPEVLAHNLDALGLDAGALDHLVFSHAHYDHTGGLETVLSRNARLALHAHPDLFRKRFAEKSGEYRFIGLAVEESELSRRARLDLNDAPIEIVPGLWTTGGITERPEPAGFSANHAVRDGEGWRQDPYHDDLSLVLKTGDGIALICGCCHAGILNTLAHVERVFGGPVTTVVGGTHLIAASGENLEHVIDVFARRYAGVRFYLNHCTGKEALAKLSAALGERVQPCPAGTLLEFQSFTPDGGQA